MNGLPLMQPSKFRIPKNTLFLRLLHVTKCVGAPTPTSLPILNIHLWLQDDVEPIVLAASSSGHWFHPKDSPVITSLIAPLSCLTYGYWARNRWVLTDGPIEIDDPSLTVYLRLEHVSSCPSGPRSKRSRSHSDETDIPDATPTPTPTLASTTVTKTSRCPAISPLKLVTKQIVPRASAEVISLSSGDEESGSEKGVDGAESRPSVLLFP
ncbi:hypothetical protein R3P38DRAFT_2801913 [Favolaschia claudopus]|uniref:Uncharacterized protein n=1 Tax=Favolaschia claudopus TaxID=2862362 RepID=A0AAV9ZV03_9AGAR